jgi:hypothetical protein
MGTDTKYKPHKYELMLARLFNWAMYELPPGPRFIPYHIIVNIQKCGMPLYLAFLIYYF